MTERLKIWLPRLLVGGSVILLLFLLARSAFLLLKYDWILINFPYNVDYGEGPVLDQVVRMAHFENIYRGNPTALPFTISNYPPLYHLLQVPFAWIFGAAFWYGRLINLLSILATALFIALILQVITRDWLAACVGGLMLLAIPYILHWSGFVRVDSLALGLSWGGLYVLVRWPDRRKALIIGGLLLTASIYTRQSYALAAPFAAFVWLLSHRPRRKAFELVAVVGASTLVIFLALNLLTRGGFYFNIVTANVNQFYWTTVRDYAQGIWRNMPYLVVGSAAFLLGGAWLRVKTWWLAAPYLVAATLSAITIGKDGSNVNYLYEFSAALSLVAGVMIAIPRRQWWLKMAFILLLAVQVNLLYVWAQKDYYRWPTDRATKDRPLIAQLLKSIHEAQGPVLADEFMGLVVLDGRPLVFQPFEFKQLSLAKVWDQRPFLDMLRKGEFALILLYDPPNWDSRHARWTDEQLSAIEKNYTLVGSFAYTTIYKPYPSASYLSEK